MIEEIVREHLKNDFGRTGVNGRRKQGKEIYLA